MYLLKLNALGLVIIVDTAISALGSDTAKIIVHSAMNILFEDRLTLNGLELGFEVLQAGCVAAAVRATASIGQVEALVLNLLAVDAPEIW